MDLLNDKCPTNPFELVLVTQHSHWIIFKYHQTQFHQFNDEQALPALNDVRRRLDYTKSLSRATGLNICITDIKA